MESGILVEEQRTLLEEVMTGLKSEKKFIPSKFFYDEKGSKLFDEICELDEYYPTRTELQIMKDNISEICALLDNETLFIEFGSGSSLKTKLILENVQGLAGYIPIDISEEHLLSSAKELNEKYNWLDIYTLAADYTKHIEFPEVNKSVSKKVAYFPGSTVGNFTKEESIKFFEIVAEEIGENGGMLIGVDLIKDKKILEAAYDDSKGVTAGFNLNILDHINNRFNADFNRDRFAHLSFYNELENRIEMHLISKSSQEVRINDSIISFKEDERILTEYSHKFSLESFADLAKSSFNVEKIWTDQNNYFAVQYLSVI